MTGIPIHTESPITPVKPSGVTPKTAISHHTPTSLTNVTTSTSSSIVDYPTARPGAGITQPTPTQALTSRYGPPPPQPGAFPSASFAGTTAKPSIPPPPRVGEVPKPPEYYSPHQSAAKQPMQQRPYPPQMALSVTEPLKGQAPSSATSTTFTPSFTPSTTLPTSERTRPTPAFSPSRNNPGQGGASLDHPPGYIQNPYATDVTPAQRFATEQSGPGRGSPGLGYNDSSRNTTSGFEDEESVWETAKKWAKGASNTVGSYVTDINEKISRNLENEK